MPDATPHPRALVTGGAAGIGKAIAQALIAEGYRVALCGRRPDRLAPAAAEIGAELHFSCDVREPASVEAGFSLLAESFKGLELLVNNAGFGRIRPFEETDEELWAATIGTNLTGTWRMTRGALPLLLKDGGGTVLNVLSVASRKAFPGNSAYCASKYGALGLAESLREEFRGRGLKVINLLPGATDTPFWDNIEGDWDRSRMLRPEAVAQAALGALRLPPEALVEEIVLGPAGGAL